MRHLILLMLLLTGMASEVLGQLSPSTAYRQYGQNKLDSAASLLRVIIDADSTRPDMRAMLSDIYRQQHQYEEASREATAALKIAPKTACYWTLLGNAHWGEGRTDLALHDYLKSLDVAATTLVQPGHAISVLRATMPYRQIESQVNALIGSSKATAEHYVLLGYSLQMQSRFQESLTAYKKALSIQPDWVEPYLFISELHRSFKQTQAMVEAYEQAVEHDPFVSSKLYKAALQDFTEALRKDTGSYPYYAIAYMHEKGLGTPANLEEARKWYAYAEQMHNHIAAVKLTQLYERGTVPVANTKEEVRRIQQNREVGRRSHQAEIKLSNGNYQKTTVYLETYPANKARPFEAENRRLRDVYGVTVELASLIPLERPIDAQLVQNRQESLATEAPLTASLMATPLLSTEVSASAVEMARTKVGKPRIALAFNEQAARYMEPFMVDSLATLMHQTLADYLGDVSQTPIMAIQRLREDIVTNRADKGFLYYAIAFLHEQMASSSDWATAEKWYTYAFQLHYTPAYQRLKRRYGQEVLSPVKLARLEKNWATGVTEIPLTLETAEGEVKSVSVYVLDNMGNSPEPIANEVARLLDLYGVEVPQQTVIRFNDLYKEARQTNVSYQDLCRQAFMSKS